MRVVGGSLRGRRLLAPEDASVRPTSDRARESLFAILTQGRVAEGRSPLLDAHVLDAFAGTGALGIEALSRGAAKASFLEKSSAALAVLRQNLRELGLVREGVVIQGDALLPARAREAASIVLLDPPYQSGLAAPALAALERAGWIAAEALISVELDKTEAFEPPPGFAVV
ncbi:MAG: 16S rRNA (guanine(966)-N(2))-methyltransferase RsmD, partial [Alphaproteobacteria bacterium]|nr:16S rRNA (guanine(966)-N(2))-methyltransferase RsmD [Alphaproteobacteria bacterium]